MAIAGFVTRDSVMRTPTLIGSQDTSAVTTGRTSSTQNMKAITKEVPLTTWKIDMSKAYHFKFLIENLIDGLALESDKQSTFKNNKIGEFLPVESVGLSLVSVSSTNLQIGIFSDLPLITKRNIGRLKVSIFDSDNQQYERALYNWFASCVPTSTGYVKCLNEMARKAKYVTYDNKGAETGSYEFYVIPDGEITVNLAYSENDLKKIVFNLAIISEINNVTGHQKLGEPRNIA